MAYTSHFTLNEFFVHCSEQEIFLALRNRKVVENLLYWSALLETLRKDLYDITYKETPIIITSCYRDVLHNARTKNSSNTSQHLEAGAIDIKTDNLDLLFDVLKRYYQPFGQLIRYDSFLHFSRETSKHHNHILDKRTK